MTLLGGKMFFFDLGSRLRPLYFKMPRSEVRELLGGEFEEFYKTEFSKVSTDAYDEYSAHFFYSEDGGLKGVEFFEGAPLHLNGDEVIGRPFSEIEAKFNKAGILLSKTQYFYESSCGVRVCVSNKSNIESMYFDMGRFSRLN
jgi:hypothetical protein